LDIAYSELELSLFGDALPLFSVQRSSARIERGVSMEFLASAVSGTDWLS